nr:hypothetical protein CFP56_10311 [Quercus suber]
MSDRRQQMSLPMPICCALASAAAAASFAASRESVGKGRVAIMCMDSQSNCYDESLGVNNDESDING